MILAGPTLSVCNDKVHLLVGLEVSTPVTVRPPSSRGGDELIVIVASETELLPPTASFSVLELSSRANDAEDCEGSHAQVLSRLRSRIARLPPCPLA